jgi:hypothetical protein
MGEFTEKLGKQQQTYRGFRLLLNGPDLDAIYDTLRPLEMRRKMRCSAVIPRPWGVLQIFTFSKPHTEDELLTRMRQIVPDASRSELLSCGIMAPDQRIEQAVDLLSGKYLEKKKPSLARAFVVDTLPNKDNNGTPLHPPELEDIAFIHGGIVVEDEHETDIVLGELVVLFRDNGWAPSGDVPVRGDAGRVSFWASNKQISVTVIYQEPCIPV